MPPHFWVETFNWKNSDGFPIQFEILGAKIDNVILEGDESLAKFNLVVLKSSSGTEMEVDITKENLVMDPSSNTSKG